MKKLILSLLLAFTFKFGHSQQFAADAPNNPFVAGIPGKPNNVPAHDYNYYRKRSIAQKTAAWFLTGGGIILTVIGAVKVSERTTEQFVYALFLSEAPESNESEVGATLICVGVGLMAGSIPLFIASHRNKLKARIAPKSEELSSFLPATANKQVHGLTLSIPLGK